MPRDDDHVLARPLLHHIGRFHDLGSPVAPANWMLLERGDLVAKWLVGIRVVIAVGSRRTPSP